MRREINTEGENIETHDCGFKIEGILWIADCASLVSLAHSRFLTVGMLVLYVANVIGLTSLPN